MRILGVIFAVIFGVVVLAGLGFGLGYAGYLSDTFFAPRYEALRRNTMTQSRAYVEGETRNLYRLKLQYQDATTPEAKQTIKLAVAHECESVNHDVLPVEIAAFCNSVLQ